MSGSIGYRGWGGIGRRGVTAALTWVVASVCALIVASPAVAAVAASADLSATELRWLQGMTPVLRHARALGMALDVVVQPQPTPGAAPLALAYLDGRCKLVLSMRGNAEAQATLDRIGAPLLDGALELMAAHELGHCRRYLDGVWHGLPTGFAADTLKGLPAGVPSDVRAAYAEMRQARREEGYGDLVGLAWTQRQHPQQYAALHAWLLAERCRDLRPGSHHDTLAWVRLAHGGIAAIAAPGTAPGAAPGLTPAAAPASIFADAMPLWAAGLSADD